MNSGERRSILRGFCKTCFFGVMLSGISSANADWKDEVGHTQLANEVGPGLETGVGVAVAVSEAWVNSTDGVPSYLPDFASPQFSGKTFTDASGLTSEVSGHSHGVTTLFVGNTGSIAPGVTNITVYQADDWLDRVMGFTSGADPAVQSYSVMNSSWIGDDTTPNAINYLQRVDYMVDRDDVLVVGGAANGSGAAVPDLLSNGYNSLIVGLTNGNHSHGLTSINGAGRAVPHIVAPASVTSNSTPMVSSAAALLHQRAAGTDAARSETMRAVLMAGATKDEFAGWDRTTTRPLDEQFGAGELNVYNSYMILEGGQFAGAETAPTFSVGLSGWDYVSEISEGDTLFYNFTIDDNFVLDDLSIALNWNLSITDLNSSDLVFDPSVSLANLDMRFYDSTLGFQDSLLDASLSTVDNLEYIYLTGLQSGVYTLEITSTSGASDFGLAWSGSVSAVPEPATWGLLAASASLLIYRRRRSQSSS